MEMLEKVEEKVGFDSKIYEPALAHLRSRAEVPKGRQTKTSKPYFGPRSTHDDSRYWAYNILAYVDKLIREKRWKKSRPIGWTQKAQDLKRDANINIKPRTREEQLAQIGYLQKRLERIQKKEEKIFDCEGFMTEHADKLAGSYAALIELCENQLPEKKMEKQIEEKVDLSIKGTVANLIKSGTLAEAEKALSEHVQSQKKPHVDEQKVWGALAQDIAEAYGEKGNLQKQCAWIQEAIFMLPHMPHNCSENVDALRKKYQEIVEQWAMQKYEQKDKSSEIINLLWPLAFTDKLKEKCLEIYTGHLQEAFFECAQSKEQSAILDMAFYLAEIRRIAHQYVPSEGMDETKKQEPAFFVHAESVIRKRFEGLADGAGIFKRDDSLRVQALRQIMNDRIKHYDDVRKEKFSDRHSLFQASAQQYRVLELGGDFLSQFLKKSSISVTALLKKPKKQTAEQEEQLREKQFQCELVRYQIGKMLSGLVGKGAIKTIKLPNIIVDELGCRLAFQMKKMFLEIEDNPKPAQKIFQQWIWNISNGGKQHLKRYPRSSIDSMFKEPFASFIKNFAEISKSSKEDVGEARIQFTVFVFLTMKFWPEQYLISKPKRKESEWMYYNDWFGHLTNFYDASKEALKAFEKELVDTCISLPVCLTDFLGNVPHAIRKDFSRRFQDCIEKRGHKLDGEMLDNYKYILLRLDAWAQQEERKEQRKPPGKGQSMGENSKDGSAPEFTDDDDDGPGKKKEQPVGAYQK